MKRIILFLPLLLLIYVNLQAGNKDGRNSLALVANFTASVTNGCVSLTTQFTSTSTSDAGDPIISYSWNFGDGSPLGTTATPSHTYTTQGFYTVSLTVTTQGGTTRTETKNDFIFAGNKPVFDLGADYTICEDGSQITLQTVTGPYIYTWSSPSITTWQANFTPVAGVNTYWATVDNNGCSTSDTIRITAAPEFDPKWGYSVLSTCGNVEVQFTDSTTMCDPGNSLVAVYWEFDGDPFYTSNPTYTFSTGGSHTVYFYVEDAFGNSYDDYITINLPNPTPGPSPIDFGGNKNICAGSSVQLDAGNEPGATYVWTPATGLSSTGIYNPIASPASTQTYSVTKTKCGVDVSGTVTVNVAPALTVNLGPDQQICPGGFVAIDAGNNPATYDWSTDNGMSYYNTRTSQIINISHGGTYWVEVTKNGCTASDTIVVTMRDPVVAAFNLTASGSGGCGPYTVSVSENADVCSGSIADHRWDFGDGTIINGYHQSYTHTYSAPGTYNITLIVTTTGNAKDTISHTVTYTGFSFAVNIGSDTAICSGSSVTLDAGPGAGYSWSNGATTRTITVSPASTTTYSVTVTNASGCTATDSRTITVGTGFTVNLGADQQICPGGFVAIDAGNNPATYDWSTDNGMSYYNTRTSQIINISHGGTYWVEVTKNGCTASDTIVVTMRDPVTAAFNLSSSGSGTCGPYNVSVSENADVCSGSIADHRWDFGDGTIINGYHQSYTHTYSAPGTYNITLIVTTTGNAKDTISHNVTYIGIGATFSVDLGDDTTICTGNNIIIDAGPGVAYSWSNGATTRTIDVSPLTTTNYSVTVTNNIGCVASDSKTVTVVSSIPVNLGSDTTICIGTSITLDAGPGASYSWSNGATTRTINVSPASATTYTVTVTNASGCTGTGSRTVNVAAAVSVNLGSDTTICAGTGMILDAGEWASYSWSNGATTRTINVSPASATTYTVTVTNASGCTGTGSRTVNVAAAVSVNLGSDTTICAGTGMILDAGEWASYSWSNGTTTRTINVSPATATTYSVTVTNVSGCTGTGSRTINVAAAVSVNLGSDTTICAGSSVTLDAGIGATYSWSNGATTRTIDVSPATATTYSVTVTNASGCTGTGSRTINVAAAVSVNLGSDTTICAGNSVTLDAGPGATYSWSNGATTRTINVSPATATTYSVTVTNASGCTGTGSRTVNVGPGLAVNLGVDTAFCPGGFITLRSGITGATYLWGSTYPSTSYNGRTTQNLNVLHPGSFWVTVTKDGCVGRDTVIVSHKDTIVPRFNTILAGSGSCGPYTVTVSENSDVCTGSVATHSWDFGDGTIITGYNQTYTHNYATAGDHTIRLIVTTTGGTKDTIERTVNFIGAAFSVNLGNDTTICTGNSLILDAGHPGSTYTWSTGEAGQTINVTTSGAYYVEVDNGLCKARDTIQVTVSGSLSVNLGNDTTICPLNSITLDAGHPGATYLWSSNVNGPVNNQTVTVSPDDPTNVYTVTVTQGGCSGTGTITIHVNSALPVNLGSDTAICSGSFITFDAGYPGATYLWNDGQSSRTITKSEAGIYKVNVTYNGCSGEDSIRLTVIDPPAPVNLGDDINVCFGNSLVLDAGEYTGVTYLWSTGETTRTITVSSSDTYSVTVSGCGTPVTDEINVTMSNLTTPVITQSGLELICSQADSYQWYKDGVLIPGATNQRYKPRGYGNYSVVVTNAALGCVGRTADYWFVPGGDFYLGDIRVKITPNPSGGQTKLVLSKLPSKPIKVTVYDRVGKRIITREVIDKVTDINMSMYAKGLYFVECILDNNRVILPLVTQ